MLSRRVLSSNFHMMEELAGSNEGLGLPDLNTSLAVLCEDFRCL
jgi:hypothetical protein